MAAQGNLHARGAEIFPLDGTPARRLNILVESKSPIFPGGYASTKVAQSLFLI